MSKRYARNPGADQIAEWKAAIAAQHRRQRGRRGRRTKITGNLHNIQESGDLGPGMVRRLPDSGHGDPSEEHAHSDGDGHEHASGQRHLTAADRTAKPSPENGPADRPGPSHAPQRPLPNHPGTPGAA